jgi:hypothetical protein
MNLLLTSATLMLSDYSIGTCQIFVGLPEKEGDNIALQTGQCGKALEFLDSKVCPKSFKSPPTFVTEGRKSLGIARAPKDDEGKAAEAGVVVIVNGKLNYELRSAIF